MQHPGILDHVVTLPRVGVTKVPLIEFSIMDKFDFAKVQIISNKLHSYLTGITTALLWGHLSNMNVCNIQCVKSVMLILKKK